MLISGKYLRISDISLIPKVTPIQAQVKQVYKIESTDVHTLNFETTFILTEKYMGTPLGTITGNAGAVISGVERDSHELIVKALEIASKLDTAIVEAINKHRHIVNYEPLEHEIYLPSTLVYMQMQNPGLGKVVFDVWGKMG